MEKILCWKGTAGGLSRMLFAPENEPQTLNQASTLIPAGAYTTFRTYNKVYALHFSSHIERLEESTRLTHHDFQLKGEWLRQCLRSALAEAPWPECRVRATVDFESEGSVFYLFLEELHIPSSPQYRNGVMARTVQTRRENPKAKLTDFFQTADFYRDQSDTTVYEWLMVSDEGRILEGLSSNFFGVRSGQIFTAGLGVLEGITRTYVLEIAKTMELPVNLEAVPRADLASLDEAFITSSSRGILPVVQIDEIVIGSGRPGPLTKALSVEFESRLNENLEKI